MIEDGLRPGVFKAKNGVSLALSASLPINGEFVGDPIGAWLRPPISEETREKLRAARLGKQHSEETKARIGAAHLGIKQKPPQRPRGPATAATRALRRLARSQQIISPEHREKISMALRGRKRSKATRAKISAANRGKWVSPETCARISASKRGVPQTEAVVAGKSYPVMTPKGRFGSALLASEALGYSRQYVARMCLRGRPGWGYDRTWSLPSDPT